MFVLLRFAAIIVVAATCIVTPSGAYSQSQDDGIPVSEDVASPDLSGVIPTDEDYSRAASTPSGEEGGSDLAGTGLKALLFLGLLSVGLFLVARFLKSRKVRRSTVMGRESQVIRVIHSTDVTASQTYQLLDLGTRIILVGVSGNGMAALAEVKDEEEMARLRLESSRENRQVADGASFTSSLRGMFGDGKAMGSSSKTAKGPAWFGASPVMAGIGKRLERFRGNSENGAGN